MTTNTKNQSPAEVADEYEKLAQQCCDDGDAIMAAQWMKGARAIRRTLKTLGRLNHRAHSGYDFNGDPHGITREVGELLSHG